MQDHDALDKIFQALSDATRRDILSKLLDQEIAIGDLASNYDISLPAISKHLRVLETARLISMKKRGKQKFATLDPDGLSSAQIWLATVNDESALFDKLEDEIMDIELQLEP